MCALLANSYNGHDSVQKDPLRDDSFPKDSLRDNSVREASRSSCHDKPSSRNCAFYSQIPTTATIWFERIRFEMIRFQRTRFETIRFKRRQCHPAMTSHQSVTVRFTRKFLPSRPPPRKVHSSPLPRRGRPLGKPEAEDGRGDHARCTHR